MELGKLTIPTDRMSKFLVVFGIVGTIAALWHSANGSLDDMITRLERMQTELNSKAVNLAAKSEKDVARDAQPEG